MSFQIVQPIWNAVQERFHKTVKALPEADLSLTLANSTIGALIVHNAEVEFMFAEWFFGKSKPEMKGTGEGGKPSSTNVQELVDLLTASNAHLTEAMKELPDDAWQVSIESPMGPSTPLQAIGRLLYHTGIHSGQISLIQKNNKNL